MKQSKKSLIAAVSLIAVALISSGCASDSAVPAPLPAEDKVVEEKTVEEQKTENKAFSKEDFINSVKTLCLNGKNAEALDLYKTLPDKYKNDFEIMLLKAKLYNVNGAFKEADALCDSLLKAKSDNEELKKLSASLKRNIFVSSVQEGLEKNGAEGGIAAFETIPESLKDDFDLTLLKASLFVSAKQLNEASELCNKLLLEQPQNSDVLDLQITIAKLKGDTKTKNEALKKMLKNDPLDPFANVELGRDSFTAKNYKQAKSYFTRALARDKKNTDALFGLGQANYYLENDDDAKKGFEEILKDNPDYAPAYSYLGKLAYSNNEYLVASENIKKAIEIDDTNYDYWMDYGTYLRYLGRFDQTEQAWTKAISIEPDYFLGYAYRAGLYDEYDKYDKALNDYKKVIELNPEYYFAYESIGILALHEKQWSNAREAFMMCAKYNAANAAVSQRVSFNISYPLMVTYCYYMEGNNEQARKYSDSVLRKLPRENAKDPGIALEYSILRSYHDLAGASNLPQKIAALKSTTEKGKLYFYVGLLFDMMGSKEMANEYYTKVVSMNSPMFFEFRIAEWNTGVKND